MSTQNFPFAEGAFGPFGAPVVPRNFPTAQGETFYVNPVSGGVEAVWPVVDEKICFSTMQGAIDACVDSRGDVIYVAQGIQSPAAEVAFNKTGITVIGQTYGMGTRGNGRFGSVIDATTYTDGPAVRVTKSCHIMNMGFRSTQATGDNYDCIMVLDNSAGSYNVFGTWIDNCGFRNENRADVNYGIYVLGAANTLCSNSMFIGHDNYSLTAGILLDNSITAGGGYPCEMDIVGNVFEDCTYAIAQVNGSPTKRSSWHGNRVLYSYADSAWGKLVNKGTSLNCTVLVSDNYVGHAHGDACSHSVADMETAGFRMCGNHYETELGQIT